MCWAWIQSSVASLVLQEISISQYDFNVYLSSSKILVKFLHYNEDYVILTTLHTLVCVCVCCSRASDSVALFTLCTFAHFLINKHKYIYVSRGVTSSQNQTIFTHRWQIVRDRDREIVSLFRSTARFSSILLFMFGIGIEVRGTNIIIINERIL